MPETLQPTPPDELLAQTLESFAGAIEAGLEDRWHWGRAEQLMLLAQWLCEQRHANPWA